MSKAWSAKRERQYEHIKDSLKSRGKKEDVAEEIAARTVNNERAQHGEAKAANRSSLKDMPAPVRGGNRSGSGEGGRTYEQFYNEARKNNIEGRSSMDEAALEKVLRR